MSYELLEKELRNLPEQYFDQVCEFVAYLKLKSKFSEFEKKETAYSDAIKKWRTDSADLLNDDADFMETAFDDLKSTETFVEKEIW